MVLPKRDSTKIIAKIFDGIIQYRLEQFRQYTLEIESKFDSDKKKLSGYYDEAKNELSEDEFREMGDIFADDYYMIEEIYIGIYRKSTLVSIYSFLESFLNKLCRHLYNQHKYPVKLEDLMGEGISRARIYLEKLAKVDFSALNGQWSDLRTLNKIRNCIVHCEGNIKLARNFDSLQNIINNNKSLSLINNEYIKIEREYIGFCIIKTEEFLSQLHQQIFKL